MITKIENIDKLTFQNLVDIARNLGDGEMDGDSGNYYEFHSAGIPNSPGVGFSLHVVDDVVIGVKVTPSLSTLYPESC